VSGVRLTVPGSPHMRPRRQMIAVAASAYIANIHTFIVIVSGLEDA
jgi:hypothetical protein